MAIKLVIVKVERRIFNTRKSKHINYICIYVCMYTNYYIQIDITYLYANYYIQVDITYCYTLSQSSRSPFRQVNPFSLSYIELWG